MDDVVGLSASALTGGTFGVLGAALGRIIGLVERRQSQAHERERWAHELQLHALNQTARDAETERELAVLTTEGGYASLRESLRADADLASGYAWVDAVRALVRPVLTPFLWLMYLVALHLVANGQAGRVLRPEAADDLIGYFLANVAFAATAATLWWFGDRAPRPKGLDRGAG